MTSFSHMTAKKNGKEHKKNKYTYNIERQLLAEFRSFSHPAPLSPRGGVPAVPRLYSPRWCWSAASSTPPPVLGGAPQCQPLDILGVLDPPPTAASIYCTLPGSLLSATERATQAFGAPPFAVLLAVLVACEAGLTAALRALPCDPPIRIGLFGPGAAAARLAAMAIQPEAAQYLVDLYAVRGAPDDPNADPLLSGVWPVLCPTYLPTGPVPTRTQALLPAARTQGRADALQAPPRAGGPDMRSQRDVLASICVDDAEASYLPVDVRRRVTALPLLMDRLYAALSALVTSAGAHGANKRFGYEMGADLADEMAETAFELTMVVRAHLVAFYARTRPARTGPVHRAAAAMLRHRPLNISPTTLTSGIGGQDLRVLEAAGWLEPRDDETTHGLAHRFTPTAEFLALKVPELPRKRPSQAHAVSVLRTHETILKNVSS